MKNIVISAILLLATTAQSADLAQQRVPNKPIVFADRIMCYYITDEVMQCEYTGLRMNKEHKGMALVVWPGTQRSELVYMPRPQ